MNERGYVKEEVSIGIRERAIGGEFVPALVKLSVRGELRVRGLGLDRIVPNCC